MRGGKIKAESANNSQESKLYHKPCFHYILVGVVLATLILSIISLVNIYQIKKEVVPRKIDMTLFFKKLTAHPELKNYVGVAPLNVIEINANNFAALQTQIKGLDVSYIGNFIVQYADKVVVFDFDKDMLRANIAVSQSQSNYPADFGSKLYAHSEMKQFLGEQPTGGKFDEESLATLKNQFPTEYAEAKVGDYLLRYSTAIVLYDYKQDKVIKIITVA